MVNTFLIHEDFRESAKRLDRPRLGKQRVEAYQILDLVNDLKLIAEILEIQITDNLTSTISKIMKEYKKIDWVILKYSGVELTSILRLSRKSLPKLSDVKKYIPTIENSNNQFYVSPKIRYHLISLNFGAHPVVRMWFHHPEALKEYIDVHIEEWISRGYKNNMLKYNVKNAPRPSWSYDPKIHKCHQESLLRKELDRNESPWYVLLPEFKTITPKTDYIWPVD